MQPAALLGAMDVLAPALRLETPGDALRLLAAAPGLLYDVTPASLAARLEQLAVVLAASPAEAAAAAVEQPVRHCMRHVVHGVACALRSAVLRRFALHASH